MQYLEITGELFMLREKRMVLYEVNAISSSSSARHRTTPISSTVRRAKGGGVFCMLATLKVAGKLARYLIPILVQFPKK